MCLKIGYFIKEKMLFKMSLNLKKVPNTKCFIFVLFHPQNFIRNCLQRNRQSLQSFIYSGALDYIRVYVYDVFIAYLFIYCGEL